MSAQPWVLGISCSHNGAACLLHGDTIVAAIQDERLLRFKRQEVDGRWATHCVTYCLDAAGIRNRDLDLIVCIETRGTEPTPRQDVFLNEALRPGSLRVPVITLSHHYGHAISVFATSGFDEAAILVIDGAGSLFRCLPAREQAAVVNPNPGPEDVECLSYYEGRGVSIAPVVKHVGLPKFSRGVVIDFPSLGLMYSAVGQRLFGHRAEHFLDGAGKVMGLAPYGEPVIPVDQWLAIEENGVIRFKPDVMDRPEAQCRWPEEFSKCANLAASVQQAVEFALLETAKRVRALSASRNLCYAGGVALNSVANETLVQHGGFDNVFIVPAAEDSGVAVGAAYHGLWQLTGKNTRRRLRRDAFGRQYAAAEIDRAVAAAPGVQVSPAKKLARDVARLLCEGKIVGWFDGGAELGPRSLGQRTILCDPRRHDAKDVLNARVKRREAFRPYAPVVLREHGLEWFDVPAGLDDSPFMLRVWPFRDGRAALVPAVAHVDNTARVQTITKASHPRLYSVVAAFHAETGVPLLLNTSFNVAGEPIVETPEDALWCLLTTGLDCCVFPDRVVHKRSDFATILDLCPHLSAEGVTMEISVLEGAMAGFPVTELAPVPVIGRIRAFTPEDIRRETVRLQELGRLEKPVAYATVKTRWGRTAVLLTTDQWHLVRRIDGRTPGRSLLECGEGWTERWLTDTLVSLRRASVIRF